MMHDIGNGGERVTVENTWSYYAHLSIYRFALSFCPAGSTVLDAGCGSGYGSAYLADHGASVRAYDAAADAIAHASRAYPRVTYEVQDLGAPLPVVDHSVDVVFSSNVFEHVPNVDGLAAECARVVKRDGVAIVAVPPVMNAATAEADIRNHFHVHHIPPAAWHAKLSRFFAKIECYDHRGNQDEVTLPPEAVTIKETDFEFPRVSVETHCLDQPITAVFVCRQPRDVALPETLAEREPAEWFIGAIVARIIQEQRKQVAGLVWEVRAPRLKWVLRQLKLTEPLRQTLVRAGIRWRPT